MDLLTVITCIAFAVLLLAAKHILYSAFISPLSKLPAPSPICHIASRWPAGRREPQVLYAAHKRYGPIVRIGSQEVSVNSLEGLHKIYGSRLAGLKKHPWYVTEFSNYGLPNLVSTLDPQFHSAQKKMITGVYAKSYLQRSPEFAVLSKRIIFKRLQPILEQCAKDLKPVEVVRLFQSAGIDFMSGYIFGTANSTDFLHDTFGREEYFGKYGRPQNKYIMERVCLSMCNSVLSARPRDGQTDLTNSVVFSKLFSGILEKARAGSCKYSETEIVKRCASEVLDHIIASHETMSITMTYALYRLSLDPILQAHLRAELLTLESKLELGSHDYGLPAPHIIDGLPLLNAVLQETLRVHSAVPGRLPRMVPESGIVLHGYHLPPGTTVSCNAYSIHRHEETFPDPCDWIPQRWLSDKEGSETSRFPAVGEMRKWFWAFGSGGGTCIGSHMVVQALKLQLAFVYSNFTTAIVNDEGIEQSNAFIAGPNGGKLILEIKPVGDREWRARTAAKT